MPVMLVHVRTVHLVLVAVSFALVSTSVFSCLDSPASVAQKQLQEIDTVLDSLSGSAFADWIEENHIKKTVVFKSSSNEDISFDIWQHATLIWPNRSSGVVDLLDSPENGTSCLERDVVGAASADTVAGLALLREFRNPRRVIERFLSSATAQSPAVQTTFSLKRPQNIDQFVTLWDYLAEPVSVLSLVPRLNGFVLHVTYRKNITDPLIEFSSAAVAIDNATETDNRRLCLMRADQSAFLGIPDNTNVSGFQYAYAQVGDVNRHDNGDITYRLYVVPATSTPEPRQDGLSILSDACRLAALSCARWRSLGRSFDKVFSHLSSAPGVADSVSFLDFLNVLEFLEESKPQNMAEISLPGLAIPMSKRTLVILAPLVFIVQIYLLGLIQVAISACQKGIGCCRPNILWVALDHNRFTKSLWIASLILPTASIFFALFTMLFDTWADVWSFSFHFELAQVVTSILSLLSLLPMIFTLHFTHALRSCFSVERLLCMSSDEQFFGRMETQVWRPTARNWDEIFRSIVETRVRR